MKSKFRNWLGVFLWNTRVKVTEQQQQKQMIQQNLQKETKNKKWNNKKKNWKSHWNRCFGWTIDDGPGLGGLYSFDAFRSCKFSEKGIHKEQKRGLCYCGDSFQKLQIRLYGICFQTEKLCRGSRSTLFIRPSSKIKWFKMAIEAEENTVRYIQTVTNKFISFYSLWYFCV